ncbi:MAG: hypothetical protein HY401_05375 [Elusimicrobia bacterium]|nr:hypothetical protein [Elusimicrobiota bacterium]
MAVYPREIKIPSPARRFSHWIIGAIFLFIYAATWDRIWQFDAVLASDIVESWIIRDPLYVVFAENHFLFKALGWVSYRLFAGPFFDLSAYQTLQLNSSLSAAAVVGILVFIFTKQEGSLIRPALGAVFLAVTASFWVHASGGESYLLSALSILIALVVLKWYLAKPNPARKAAALLAAILPPYVHTGNVILTVIIGAVILKTCWQARWKTIGLALGLWLAAGLPYIVIHNLYDPAEITAWWVRASNSRVWYALRATNSSWNLDLTSNISRSWMAWTGSGIASTGWPSVLILILTSLGLALGFTEKPEQGAPPVSSQLWAKVVWVSFGIYVIFYSLWQPGNATYWSTHWMLLVMGILSLSQITAARRLVLRLAPSFAARRLCLAGVAAGILGIGSSNFQERIYPNTLPENAPLAYFAQSLPSVVPQDSIIFISGVKWGELKPYIPFFSKRKRVALELMLIRYPPDRALDYLGKAFVQAVLLKNGIFVTSDFWDKDAREILRANWGVNSGDLDHLLDLFDRKERVRFAPPSLGEPLILYELTPNKEFFEHFSRARLAR